MRLKWWELLFTLRAAPGSIAARARGVERLFPYVAALAFAALIAGISLPLIDIERFFVFSDRLSILDGIATLFAEGEVAIAGIVLVFSIVLPALKLVVAAYVWRGCPLEDRRTGRVLRLLDWVGRWSMLDVLVVGLVIVSVKASAMASANSEPGLYCFTGAVVASAAAIGLLKLAEKRLMEVGGMSPPLSSNR